jgi:leucyl-tRNA synthetase
MDYNFKEIEQKWQKSWKENHTYRVKVDPSRPKYYVLDMFPYPSGAGLHVGHPLGYIASDIYTRYKRLKGFNVLHPMGYDAFGLPAEQYAIQTGQHPAVTTDQNIKRYREQMDKIGFSYDWARELRTSDPEYYKWTQWAFVEMFHHYYNTKADKAQSIPSLEKHFSAMGTEGLDASCTQKLSFTSSEWNSWDENKKQEILLNYRLAYRAETLVNWCPALGTVLANDEVKEGVSVRGGHPVEQKKMQQWLLRVTAYAARLLNGLDKLEWSDSLKEIQRNWIGRSEGVEMLFELENTDVKMEIFTTRPDTLFGVTFMVIAPESELAPILTIPPKKKEVEEYIAYTKKRSERERMTEAKKITGVFTGSYAIHPFTGEKLPVWISEYVLISYGTGAIMAVPAHDERDYAFAKHFNLPIREVISGGDISVAAFDAKDGIVINSEPINGLRVPEAIKKMLGEIEKKGIGNRKINYRLRDAIFSRQRYWGEPFPVYFKNGLPYTLGLEDLPLELPEIDAFKPTKDGDPPLGRAAKWENKEGYKYEMSTMPGFAGSSAYYLRYMDPRNNNELVSREANEYWQDVDLYIGGIEHATGHLIYSRFWNKFLFDTGKVCKDEPFKKLVNQGMIQGRSNFVYRIKNSNKFVSLNLMDQYEVTELRADVNIVHNDVLDIEAFKKWNPDYKSAEFILEDGKYICGWAVEKMSKSMYNVVNPDDIIKSYGADTLRIYEMFLGPLEQSKPWDTNGIDGVSKFLRKFWKMYVNEDGSLKITNENPLNEELKVLHKSIKKISSDIEKFSFNTSVSEFMICLNSLNDLKCNKRAILEPLVILLAPFAPHISEELWHILGHKTSIFDSALPMTNETYLVENEFEYPVSINGKMRLKIILPLDMGNTEIEKLVLAHETTVKWLEGKPHKKIIIVKGKIINLVV